MVTPTEKTRSLGIHNVHNLITKYVQAHPGTKLDIYIDYRAATPGPASQTAAWQAVRPGFRTDRDPNAYWRDYGHMTWSVWTTSDKATALNLAAAWVARRTGTDPSEWVKAPWVGSTAYVHRDVATWLREQVKAVA